MIPRNVLRRLAAVVIAACASTAARADTKDITLRLWPDYAITYVDTRAPSGAGLGGEFGVGITESLTLQATGFTSWHPVAATKTTAAGTMGEFGALVGLNYALDLIRLVPSFDAAFGVLGLRGDAQFSTSSKAASVVQPSTALGVALGFGLDYAITRHVEVGVVVRYHAFLTDLTRVPVYLYVGPRVTLRFSGKRRR